VQDLRAFVALCDKGGFPGHLDVVVERNFIGVPGDSGVRVYWSKPIEGDET